MKLVKPTLLFAALFIAAITFAGVKTKVTKGDLNFLKGQTDLTVIFDYSNAQVSGSKNEQEYIDKKVKENEKDKPGQGAEWKSKWEGQKTEIFQRKFVETFGEATDKKPALTTEKKGKYTLKVNTIFIEPGFNAMVARKDASINVEYIITDESGNVVYQATMSGIPGAQFGGYDFAGSARLGESYAKAGKELGKLVAKATK